MIRQLVLSVADGLRTPGPASHRSRAWCLALACVSYGGCAKEVAAPRADTPSAPAPDTARAPEGALPAQAASSADCAEIQVFPRFPGEPVQRLRAQPEAKLRLSRLATTWSVTLPVGSTLGRTEQGNDYVGEQLEAIRTERTATFSDDRYLVHCLAQPTSPSAAGAAAP